MGREKYLSSREFIAGMEETVNKISAIKDCKHHNTSMGGYPLFEIWFRNDTVETKPERETHMYKITYCPGYNHSECQEKKEKDSTKREFS